MQIQWYGLSCFKIQTKDATIFMDPFFDTSGLKLKKRTSDIVTISNKEASNIKVITECSFYINTPGEFEVKGVFVFGIDANKTSKQENIIYRLDVEGIRIVHLGVLADELNNKQLETLSRVDVLMIPVGGGDVLNYEKALKVINQLQPSVIIPMYYNVDKLTKSLDVVDKFCKEVGCDPSIVEDKYKFTKKELHDEDGKVVLLRNL